jgi:hypothetical protein
MSAADGFLTPSPGAARAELEHRYRRLLRLYPREFRARRADEMLGVLMASAGQRQNRPAPSDVRDIVRSSLVMRLRGPRGGWPFALAAFALVAPLFLVLTDILQVAFPYQESQAARLSHISFLEAHGVSAADIPPSALVPQHVGGLQLLGQPAFLLLVAGHLIVAAAVVNGLRRTALAALVIAAAADATQWNSMVFRPGTGTMEDLTIAVFLLEAIALAAADPRAARRREGWQHVFPALVLAVAAQVWTLAYDASMMPVTVAGLRPSSGDTIMVIGFALTALGMLLPLPLGLGWRTSALLAAACYPLVILGATVANPYSPPIGRLARQAIGPGPALAAHTGILAVMFLPPLLVLAWAVAQAARTRRATGRSNLAA